MQQAKDAGIEKLYLFTHDREGFYQRLGWQVLSIEDYRECSDTVMRIEFNGLAVGFAEWVDSIIIDVLCPALLGSLAS